MSISKLFINEEILNFYHGWVCRRPFKFYIRNRRKLFAAATTRRRRKSASTRFFANKPLFIFVRIVSRKFSFFTDTVTDMAVRYTFCVRYTLCAHCTIIISWFKKRKVYSPRLTTRPRGQNGFQSCILRPHLVPNQLNLLAKTKSTQT